MSTPMPTHASTHVCTRVCAHAFTHGSTHAGLTGGAFYWLNSYGLYSYGFLQGRLVGLFIGFQTDIVDDGDSWCA